MIHEPSILIFSLLIIFQAQAQQKYTSISQSDNWASYQKNNQQAATQLAKNKAALLLNEHDDLKLIATATDELGFKHYRYQQYYKGIPIEGAIYLMHEKEEKVTLSNGQLIKNLIIATQPSLSEKDARFLAIQFIDAKLYAWQSNVLEAQLKRSNKNSNASYFPTGTLTIINSQFSPKTDNYRLAFKFSIYALEPHSQNEVYVDAHTGEILLVLNNVYSCTETSTNVKTNYSGNVNVSVCLDDGAANHLKSGLYGGLEVRDYYSNNPLLIEDSLAVEVLWATQKTFDYFNVEHNRNIADSVTISKINYTGDFYGAYYFSKQGEIVYCDGNDSTHKAYTTPDIVGHELTHGVNKFSANLFNRYQSGALNESFADIFGALVEAHCLDNTDWIIGTQVSPTNNGLRNLSKPKDETMKTQQPNTYLGENWQLPSSICIRNNDHCGVHRNSGVQNYWFYLLAVGGNGINDNGFSYAITGIGKQKAAQIAYRNLTSYLTPSATYKNAQQGAIQAAIDLFGENSFEVKQTQSAWRAVGVTNNPIKITTTNEAILANGSIEFELLVDSLNQAISCNNLVINLDVQNNYNVVSIVPIHSNLLIEETNIDGNNISISRINPDYLSSNKPLFKVTAILKENSLVNNLSTFEINGGTNTSNAGFIAFKDALINVSFQNCVDENTATLNNWLPLITSTEYETSNNTGAATVKILDSANGPFTHIWTAENGTIVYDFVGYEPLVTIPNLPTGIYQVTVNDSKGNCSTYPIKISALANNDGNNLCRDNCPCPNYLTTPNANLQGSYKASVALEIKGFINKKQNASFSICN